MSPLWKGQRLTARLRVNVVKHFVAGLTTRQVAEELGLGRHIALGILPDAGVVAMRPQVRDIGSFLVAYHSTRTSDSVRRASSDLPFTEASCR